MFVVNSEHAPADYVHPEYGCVCRMFNNDGLRISLSKRTQTDDNSSCQQKLGIQCVSSEQISAILCRYGLWRLALLSRFHDFTVHRPTWMWEKECKSPVVFNSHKTTAMTTTALSIDLMVRCIGMKRLISHRTIPTTMRIPTSWISGITPTSH